MMEKSRGTRSAIPLGVRRRHSDPLPVLLLFLFNLLLLLHLLPLAPTHLRMYSRAPTTAPSLPTTTCTWALIWWIETDIILVSI